MNNTIDLLNTLFLVCMVLSGVFLVLSVVLFFVFDIRSIFNIRTGRAKKKTVQEMQEANSRTDTLKVGKTGQRMRRGSNTGPLGGATTSRRLRHSAEITPAPKKETEAAPVPQTEVLVPETSVLQATGAEETTVLRQQEAAKQVQYNFTVIKRIVMINTEEFVS